VEIKLVDESTREHITTLYSKHVPAVRTLVHVSVPNGQIVGFVAWIELRSVHSPRFKYGEATYTLGVCVTEVRANCRDLLSQ